MRLDEKLQDLTINVLILISVITTFEEPCLNYQVLAFKTESLINF